MSCETHPNSGVVWLGDTDICYGCYCEQFAYCPLCGRKWVECSCSEIVKGCGSVGSNAA